MRRGERNLMRQSAFIFALSFGPYALLCCMLALLLSGCTLFPGYRHALIATVPAQSVSPARFNVTMSTSTRSIDFDGFQGQEGNQTLRISVINRSRHAFEVSTADEKHLLVAPDERVELYSGEIARGTDSIGFPVNVLSRTHCEFQVEVSNPARFHNAIRVYLNHESAPM
jgi:hypothetical protein